MMTFVRRHRVVHAVAIGFLAFAAHAVAQEAWPSKSLRIIAPVQPGGGVDLVARTIAERLTTSLGQSVVVENQSGGGGIVGSLATAFAAIMALAPARFSTRTG